jgi:SAM-dependent methyltransferase
VQIVHTDLKAGEGVDISGDIYDADIQAKLRAVGAKCVLCCNIFEHIEDRAAFAEICDNILLPGGHIIISVPYSYPYHLDPIDAYYRPKPDEIASLFPGYSTLEAERLKCGSHWNDIDGAADILKAIVKSAILRGGLEASKARAHRLLWLFRPYQVSVVVLRKPG